MYQVEALLGLMFLFWAAAIWASFLDETPKPAIEKK